MKHVRQGCGRFKNEYQNAVIKMAEMSSTVHIMPTQDGRDVVYCAYSAREPNQAVWRTTCEPLDAGLPPKNY